MPKDVDGSSPSSTHSLEVATTTLSMIKPKSGSSRKSKIARMQLVTEQEQQMDDLEQNIPVTMIDHEMGMKR